MNTILVSTTLGPSDAALIDATAELSFKVMIQQIMLYHSDLNYTQMADPGNFGLGLLSNVESHEEQEDTLTALKVRTQRKVNHSAIVNCKIDHSKLADALPEIIDKEQVELVIISKPAKPKWSDFFGPDTTAIIKASKVPVLIVPEQGLGKVKGIALACELGETHAALPVDMIKRWVNIFNAQLYLVYNNDDVAAHDAGIVSEQHRVQDLFEELNPVFYSPGDTNTVRGIAEYIERHDIQLLICTYKKFSFWRSLLHQSVIPQLVQQSSVPIMVVKA